MNKKQRAAAAAQVKAAAEELGAAVEITELPSYHDTIVDISHMTGVRASISFSDRSFARGRDWEIVAWYLRDDGKRFAPIVGEVNPCHGCKATHVVYGGLQGVITEVARVLTLANEGRAVVVLGPVG